MARTRAVLFDADHTLFDTQAAERRALETALVDVGLPFSPRVLSDYRLINDRIWAAYRRGEIDPESLSRERFRSLLATMGAPARFANSLGRGYLKAMSKRGDLLPGCRTMLRALVGRYRLGIVTNGVDRVQRSRLKAARLESFFDVIVTSEGCGYTKPDPRIMTSALMALGVRPEEALYVGDDRAVDGGAARAASVPFLWLTASPGRGRIKSLGEIPPLLARKRS